MITLVEALNYRHLQHLSKTLEPFQVLVDPNAAVKATFCDAVGFLQDLLCFSRIGTRLLLIRRQKNG